MNLVGLGASAGGIEALGEFVSALPATTGMAFLLVQHRDPDHPSLLSEILSKNSSIAIVDAKDDIELVADRLYVVPADATVAAVDGTLRLHQHESALERRMPIDSMFRVLAHDRGQSSIGVVLSGTGSDGAIGIQEIKGAGGITFAQEPNSARFNGMPRKAIETECVDFVLTPGAMAEKISTLAQHPYLFRGVSPDAESAADENSLKRIFRLLRAQARVDFSQYKRSTIQRRLGRRMALRHIQGLSEYEEVLRDDRSEADALVQDFLIHVTGFFRHPEDFRGLTESVFPPLLENRSQKDPIRIWVPGCASGEEVYSLAILLTEFLGDRSTAIQIQIFGTDLSDTAVAQARSGEYLSNIEREVSGERLRRFFIKLDDHYQIAKPIRDLCIFARHDLTYDPPYSRLDLISCRNVLIYFDLNLQRRVMQSFHYALKPGGFLQVGPSESIGQNSELFQLVDPHYRIYGKQLKPGGIEPRAIESGTKPVERGETVSSPVSAVPDLHRAQRETDRLVISRYAPATVLLDENLNTVYFQGNTRPYLELAHGGASLKLQRILRPGLQMDVFSAIEQARNRGVPIRRERVRIEESGQVTRANIEVVPLNMADSAGVFYVLFFENVATPTAPGLSGRLAHWWMEILQTRRTDQQPTKIKFNTCAVSSK